MQRKVALPSPKILSKKYEYWIGYYDMQMNGADLLDGPYDTLDRAKIGFGNGQYSDYSDPEEFCIYEMRCVSRPSVSGIKWKDQ